MVDSLINSHTFRSPPIHEHLYRKMTTWHKNVGVVLPVVLVRRHELNAAITEIMKVHTDAMKTDAKSTYVRTTHEDALRCRLANSKMKKKVPCRRRT